MAVCFILTLTPGFLNCEKSTMGEVWVILIVCGVVQSIMICLCSCYLAKTMKSRADLLRRSIQSQIQHARNKNDNILETDEKRQSREEENPYVESLIN